MTIDNTYRESQWQAFLSKHIIAGEWEQGWCNGESTRLPPCNVARVRFSDPASYVG